MRTHVFKDTLFLPCRAQLRKNRTCTSIGHVEDLLSLLVVMHAAPETFPDRKLGKVADHLFVSDLHEPALLLPPPLDAVEVPIIRYFDPYSLLT